jgi:hypothetical protein
MSRASRLAPLLAELVAIAATRTQRLEANDLVIADWVCLVALAAGEILVHTIECEAAIALMVKLGFVPGRDFVTPLTVRAGATTELAGVWVLVATRTLVAERRRDANLALADMTFFAGDTAVPADQFESRPELVVKLGDNLAEGMRVVAASAALPAIHNCRPTRKVKLPLVNVVVALAASALSPDELAHAVGDLLVAGTASDRIVRSRQSKARCMRGHPKAMRQETICLMTNRALLQLTLVSELPLVHILMATATIRGRPTREPQLALGACMALATG